MYNKMKTFSRINLSNSFCIQYTVFSLIKRKKTKKRKTKGLCSTKMNHQT